jgi:PKD repeat protein
VWNDLDGDGIQDAGEPGIPGVTVQLYAGEIVATTTADIHGYYSFTNFTPGNYSLQFILPQGYTFSPQNQGTNDKKDSDADPSTGRTVVTPFDPSINDTSWDTGMFVPDVQGKPVQHSISNHAPTADGTAGEPYKGFVGEEIRFNGSRSYDRDGTIVSWQWSFGDGITADGAIVTHAYTDVGSYPVALTVTDNAGATDTFTTIAMIRVPNRPPVQPQLSGPTEGHRNTSYSYSVVTTDPDGDDVLYMIDWGDGSQNITSLYRSGHAIYPMHQWSALGFYLVRVSAQDSSNATSDAYQVLVSIDVRYVGSLGYLINTDGIGPFDMFYSNETGNQTAVHLQNGVEYLIDTNGDGSVDHLFNTQSGILKAYPETLGTVYIMLLIGLVVVILLVVLVSFIMKRRKGTPKE